MTKPSRCTAVLSMAAVATAVLFALAGCNKGAESTQPSQQPTTGASATTGSDAVALFQANCAKCHKMGDVGGGRAPDLSHAGAESSHTAEWIAAQIKDPKSHDPQSRMPGFAGKLSDLQIESLANHLAGLK